MARQSDIITNRRADGTQSIRRAVSILRELAVGREAGLSLSQITRTTDLRRPTVHRILHALIEEGIVEQNPRTLRYKIGEQIPLLALARPSRSLLAEAAEPHLERARKEIGDTVFLTVRTGLETLCVARRIGSYPIQVLPIEVGARRPLGVSSAGIAMLASLPDEECRDILARNSERLASYGMTVDRALDQVARARAKGYAAADPGLVPGTKAISVAISGSPVSPIAALTIAAIRQRLSPRREPEIADYLRTQALETEKALQAGQAR